MQRKVFRPKTETSAISLVSFALTGILLAFLAACGGSSPAPSVAVTATATTVDGTDTTTLAATVTNDQNSAGVTWSTTAGTLSNTTTTSATFTAPAATSSSQTITITATSVANSSKTGTVTITVPAAPAVTSTSASLAGSVGTTYSVQLQASGGISPYTWSLGSGTTLPACLTLKSTGVITTASGLPPTASCVGTYSNLTFKVTDSGTPTALSTTSAALSITITAPTITFPASLAGASVGTPYSGSVAATGALGTTTYTMSGTFPTSGHLTFNTSTGAITGTPYAADAGTYNFSVSVTDQYGDTATSGSYTLKITAPTISFPASLPGASVGTAYNTSAAATGTVGTTTYTLSGSLPASGDLVFNTSTGAIVGTPKAGDVAGSPYHFTVSVTDQYGDTATSGTLSIAIAAVPAITWGTAPTATATDGVAYSSSLSASGGAGSLTYSITIGALPTGLTLNGSTGAITGTPTGVAQAYNFTAQAADNFGDTPATQAYTITVAPGAATHYSVAVTSSTTITAGGTVNFTVTALDAYSNTATGYAGTVKFTSSDAQAALPANSTLTSGTGSFTATLKTAGSQTVTATDTSNATITGTSGAVAVSPGSYTQLVVSAPSTVSKGVAFNFTVTAEDAYGNSETGNSDSLTFSSSDTATGVVLPGTSNLTNGAGTFSATLITTTGTQTITATDTTASKTGTSGNITVTAALIITTSSLNPLDVGQSATQVLAASGGSGNSANYSWSWTAQAGSSIPPGLSLSTGGAIQGSPTTAGAYQVTVKVTDSVANQNYSANFTITIDSALSLPSPDPASLPSTAYAGYAYNSGSGGTITGSGGSGNLSISVASGLPADGLSGSPSGATLTVSGTPTSATTVTFNVKLTDNITNNSITTTGYSITVSTASAVTLPTPTTSVPGSATVNQSYSGTITASNGVPPYTWSINGTAVTSGGYSLGDGITATSTGGSTLSFSGTPSTAETVGPFTVKVVDSESPTTSASNSYSVVVNTNGGQVSGQISLSNVCGSVTLPTFTVGVYNGSTLVTSGTTDSNGNFSISGIPAGTYTITPSITGASSVFSPASYTGVVVSNGSNFTGDNFNAVVGYTVSGAVSYSGTQTGQTYLYLQNNNCSGNQGNPGTSITEATLTSGGSYSIRGVAPGSYTLYAWMDSTGVTSGTDYPGPQGAPNANNPLGSNNAVSVTNASVSNANVTLANPTYATPPNNPSITVIPSAGGVVISYSPPTVNATNGNSEEAANEYTVNWAQATSTDSDGAYCALGGGSGGYQFATVAGTHTFYATGNNSDVWILNNTSMGSGSFTSGGTYCFQVRAFNTLASTTHPSGAWATQSDGDGNPQGVTLPTSTTYCTSSCTTVSGAVTIPSSVTIAAGAPLYIGLYQQSSSGKGPSAIYAEEIASPVSGGAGNSYSLTIPNGSGYVLFGILDQNNDGAIDAYDVTNTRNNKSSGVTFSGGTSTQNLTLPSANSTATVQTQYTTCGAGCSSYSLNLLVYQSNKLPVSVTLSNTSVATPYVMTPVDVSLCASCGSTQFDYSASVPGGTPGVGDSFDFTVTYSDGTTDSGTTVNGAVSAFGSTGAVAGASDAPTNLQATAGTEPDFSWTDSTNAMGTGFYYSFYLNQTSGTCPSNNCTIWQIPGQNSNSNGFSSSITSLTWGTDPTGGGSLPSGSLNSADDYNWIISVQDSNGNQAQAQATDNNP